MIKKLYNMTDEELKREMKWLEAKKGTFCRADYVQIRDEIEEAMNMSYKERKEKLWNMNINILSDFVEAMKRG